MSKDYLNKDGAETLRAALTSYWALRCGALETPPVRVLLHIVNPDYSANLWHARYDLRSDMVNGTPRGFAWRFDGTKPKGKRWRLVDERAETAGVSPPMVGQSHAGAEGRARTQEQGSRAPAAQPDRAREEVGRVRRVSIVSQAGAR